MAGDERDSRRKRFSRSGSTSHDRRPATPAEPGPQHQPPPYGPPPNHPPNYTANYPPQYYPPQYGPPPVPPPAYPPQAIPGGYGPPPPYPYAPPVTQSAPGFGAPTYHGGQPADQRKVTGVARTAAVGTSRAARYVTRRVISASRADGAHESGLSALIWNQVLSYGTDAMITVALASTVFFGASTHAQRGNVLLYLLVTMAPFALVAPVIGPALDRLQHGRRWSMAGTGVGRAILAVIMAGHPTDLIVLYPCALGSLVLSKAYSVIRAAAAPRLVPAGMTLVEANARLSMFGLASALVGGGLIGAVIKTTGSYSAGLWVTAIAFAACAFFAFRLPRQVDSATPAPASPHEPRPRQVVKAPPRERLRTWATRGFAPQVVTSLQGESALRFLAGFLTIFMAFWVESTRHGVGAAVALGAVVGAAGAGNFVGTALGARLHLGRPEIVIMTCAVVAGAVSLLTAGLFTIDFAVIGMLASASCNALAKIALDAVIQRDVTETLRSSGFARSETFLQLAWVAGAALGCILPATHGSLGFWIGGAVVSAVGAFLFLRNRAIARAPSTREWQPPPGNLAPGQSPPSS